MSAADAERLQWMVRWDAEDGPAVARALAEIDRLRARVAELEAERDAARTAKNLADIAVSDWEQASRHVEAHLCKLLDVDEIDGDGSWASLICDRINDVVYEARVVSSAERELIDCALAWRAQFCHDGDSIDRPLFTAADRVLAERAEAAPSEQEQG